MKKALVLLLALSMVFGAFADEPVANVNVSEFKGEASVTWGVDLDESRTGFKNDAKVTLKLNLIDGGDKSSTGEGVWGEIKIKTDGDTFTKVEGNDVEFGALTIPAKIKVDTAKLHFGDNAYIGITSGDTKVGEYKLDTAVAAEVTKNDNFGDGDYKNGIVAGYGNDLFSVDVDFRSMAKEKADIKIKQTYQLDDDNYLVLLSNGEWEKISKDDLGKKGGVYSTKIDTPYTNAYAFAIDGALKAVDNLTLKGGYSKDIANKWDETVTDAFYVAADYKLGLNDTFYLKPQIGYVHAMASSDVCEYKLPEELGEKIIQDWKTNAGKLVAAVLFGWGDKADKKPGVYFLDNDDDKKVIPGFSVAMEKALVSKVAGSYEISDDKSVDAEVKGTASPMTMKISFFSGEIVENLTAAAYYETAFGATDYEATVDGEDVLEGTETKEEVNPGFAFAAGLKYKLAVGEGSITPQFGIAMLGGYYGKPSQIAFVGDAYNGEILNLQAGVEFGGYVENTTFSIDYASKNLKDGTKDAATAGTLNFKCKIAL